jgi:hypothetical protein
MNVAGAVVDITDVLVTLAGAAPEIEALVAAKAAGVTTDALIAAIKAATLALSDDAMRAELAGAAGG